MNHPRQGELWLNEAGDCLLYVLSADDDDLFIRRCLVVDHPAYPDGDNDVWDLRRWHPLL